MGRQKKSIQPTDENAQSETVERNTSTENTSAESTSGSINDDGNVGEYQFEVPKTFGEVQEERKIESEQPAQKVEEKEFDLKSIMSEFGAEVPEEKRKRKPRKPKEAAPEAARVQLIIPGRLFVTVCDNALVGGIGALDAWISKKPIDTDLLKLSEQQINDLAPLAEEAVKAMKLENDPITVYFGSLAAIYISNYLQLRAHMNKMEKEYKQRTNGKI